MRIFPTNNLASLIKMQPRKPDSSHGGLGVHKHLRWPRCSSFTTLNWIKQRSLLSDLPCGSTNAPNLPFVRWKFLRFSKMECSRCDSRDSVLGCTVIICNSHIFRDGLQHSQTFLTTQLVIVKLPNSLSGWRMSTPRGLFFGKSSRWQVLDRKGGFKSNVQQSTFNTLILFNWGTLLPRLQNFLNWLEPIFFSAECLCFWW